MRKMIYFLILLLFIGCKQDGAEFRQTFNHYNANSGDNRTQKMLDDLTDNGRTLPTSHKLSKVINNPGDINYKCQECTEEKSGGVIRNSSTKDPNYQVALKNYKRPSRGCIPAKNVSLSEAKKLIKSQNLTTRGARPMEIRTLGAALKRIQQLAGGVCRLGRGSKKHPYPFVFVDNNGTSAQRATYIRINRHGKRNYGLSVAQYVHEYAHYIGNNGGYAAFERSMRRYGKCVVSNYANRNWHEQFAEVFTAFVTEPSILLSNRRSPRACKHAFEFFKKWFKRGDRVKECM